MGSRSKPPKQKPSEQEKALAEVASAKWQRFKDRGIPLEDSYIESVLRLGGTRETDALAGQGVATVQQAITGPEGTVTENPGSGRFLSRLTRSGLSTAMGRSGSEVSARTGARGRHLSGLSSLLKLGKGMEDTALQGLSRGGQLATSRAIAEAQATMQERQAKSDLAGTLTGLGLDYAMLQPSRTGRTVEAREIIPDATPGMTLNLPY